MTKFYNSGLGEVSIYSEHHNEDPFYTTHCLRNYFGDDLKKDEIITCLLKEIKYSLPLIAQYYHTVSGIDYVNRKDIHQKVQSKFESDLTNCVIHIVYYNKNVR